MLFIFEGNLEVEPPTKWTDEKQRWEEYYWHEY
jgi:hypothetical protein